MAATSISGREETSAEEESIGVAFIKQTPSRWRQE